jgi:hypothetical protein
MRLLSKTNRYRIVVKNVGLEIGKRLIIRGGMFEEDLIFPEINGEIIDFGFLDELLIGVDFVLLELIRLDAVQMKWLTK